MTPQRNIVAGQFVREEKLEAARKLRQEATPAERTLWEGLRGKKLGGWKFRRQQVIDGFIVDFYCPEVGLVIELDGSIHEKRKEYDCERDELLKGRGLRILRLPNDRVERELPKVLTEIREWCGGSRS